MNFDEFTRDMSEEQLIDYIKYLRSLAESCFLDTNFETLDFDKPGSTFIYLNFLKKFVDKSLGYQISEARRKLDSETAKILSAIATDFNNNLLKNENYDFSEYNYLKRYYNKLLAGLKIK